MSRSSERVLTSVLNTALERRIAELTRLGNAMSVHAVASNAHEQSDRLADAIDAWEAATETSDE